MPSRTQSIPLDLAGFTGPELTILVHHLQYAANRLEQEMNNVRQVQGQRCLYPGKAKPQPPGLLISHSQSQRPPVGGEAALWAGLIRDHRYFTTLARAVETVVDGPWNILFLADGSAMQPLTLPGQLAGNNEHFIIFLNRELHRARLAVDYLRKETFDERVKQDLLLALMVEVRFFSFLLDQYGQLIPPYPAVAWPEEDRVPLLFVSLPRVSMISRTSVGVQSDGQAT